MRLPIASPLVSRDGSANKDARLTNMLKEVDSGRELAVVRPGLEYAATGTGAGGGLVAFNNELISVYGTTLGTVSVNQYVTWTKVGATVMDQVNALSVSTGSVALSGGQASYNGVSWNPTGTLGAYDQLLAVDDSIYLLYLGIPQLYKTIDGGQTQSLVSDLPSTAGNFQYVFYVAPNLYLVDVDAGQSWISADLGISWSETFPASPSAITNGAFPILAGSRLYVFDGINGVYEYTDNYLDFTGGSLYSSNLGIGFYENNAFIGYNYSTGDVVEIPTSAMNTATVLAYVNPAAPFGDYGYLGQPFKIGSSAFVFGDDGIYRAVKNIDSLGTVASGIYDFAQGPL